MENNILVQVAYAVADNQKVLSVEVPVNSTVGQAIHSSGILQSFREIDLDNVGLGIYGKIVGFDQILRDQDRVEIYRPLATDPMQARRIRADIQK
jgi:putative ubiquitin-RnfH superfamily antitoxin RatB of RatAB toxin-antitoxin module